MASVENEYPAGRSSWAVPAGGLPIIPEDFGANRRTSRAVSLSERLDQPREGNINVSGQREVAQHPEWTVVGNSRQIEERFSEDQGIFRGDRGRLPTSEGRDRKWDPNLMVD